MPRNIVKSIRDSRLTICDSLNDRPDLFLDHVSLEKLPNRTLRGLNLDYPLCTRSKVLKAVVCGALGYPIPIRFSRTQPRFPGQNFDTYVQKANNLQIWNEKVTASRQYVLIRVDEHNRDACVRVVTGEKLAAFDTTGTLTHQCQARAKSPVAASVLVSRTDTPHSTFAESRACSTTPKN